MEGVYATKTTYARHLKAKSPMFRCQTAFEYHPFRPNFTVAPPYCKSAILKKINLEILYRNTPKLKNQCISETGEMYKRKRIYFSAAEDLHVVQRNQDVSRCRRGPTHILAVKGECPNFHPNCKLGSNCRKDQVLWGRTEDTTATDCTEFAVEFGQTPIGCSPHKITSTAKEVSLVNIAPSECQDD
eukprot:jgi/Bigna1/140369/aug1.55_g15077